MTCKQKTVPTICHFINGHVYNCTLDINCMCTQQECVRYKELVKLSKTDAKDNIQRSYSAYTNHQKDVYNAVIHHSSIEVK